jgi:hypothetical protein
MHYPSSSHKLRVHKNCKLLKIWKNFKLKFCFSHSWVRTKYSFENHQTGI